jgi:hypothetical protein
VSRFDNIGKFRGEEDVFVRDIDDLDFAQSEHKVVISQARSWRILDQWLLRRTHPQMK